MTLSWRRSSPCISSPRSGRAWRRVAAVALLVALAGCSRFVELELKPPSLPPRPDIPVYDYAPQPADPTLGAGAAQAAARAAAHGPRRAARIVTPRRAPIDPQLIAGDRDLMRLPLVAAPAAGATALGGPPEGDVTVNFADADVNEVAQVLFGTILERNYLVSPDVQGRVTFQTVRPLPRDALIGVFNGVLATIGATILDRGSLIEILPTAQASRAGPPFARAGADTPGFRVQAVPLSYVRASEIEPIIASIGGEGSVLSIDDRRNILLLAGSERALAPLLEAVSLFDQNWFEGFSFGISPLENVAAETAAADMEAIFGGDFATPGLAARFVPINRLNAVVVIAPEPDTVSEIMSWVHELDRATQSEENRVFVYFAQNTKASDLATALSDVLSITGPTSASVADRSAASEPPAEPVVQEPVESVAELAARRFGGGGGAGVDVTALRSGAVRIVAEEKRNAVLVASSAREWRQIEAILNQLDVPPLQVLLEVTIAEVVLDDSLNYGLQWFFRSGSNNITLSQLASGAVAGTFPGFSYVFAQSDIQVALNALASITDVNVISSPSLMVVNNETATLQVGDQVPIATQSAVDVGNPNAPIVNSIQFRDTGVLLRVTPRVNNSGLVLAEIEQEVSTVSTTTSSGIDSPTISTRKISSTVAVADGASITLGGLIQDSRTQGRSGLPVLSDIPFLGAAFRNTRDEVRRTELLVIVTPRIVRDGSEARAVTSELRGRLSTARFGRTP